MERTSSRLAAEPRRTDGYLPVEDYAAIGDGHTLALVGIDGSIDWMCLPELDAPSIFAALLDVARGGSFSLAPACAYEAKHAYLPHTNVLCTEFETAQGAVRLTDALTIDPAQAAPWRELAREVEGVWGNVALEWRVRPRFDYARRAVEPRRCADGAVWRDGDLQVGVRSWDAGETSIDADSASGAFELAEGRRALLSLVASDEVALPAPNRQDLERRLRGTVELWRAWVARAGYEGPWKEAVQRSLLAIRLLSDRRTGAITAAGTTSLPETLGGQQNYDYRFAWVRDLSFTVEALLRVGMGELADTAVRWLLYATANTHPRIDPLYDLKGEVVRSQQKLPLSGYRRTSPVHLGNQAGVSCSSAASATCWRRCLGTPNANVCFHLESGSVSPTVATCCARYGRERTRGCGSWATARTTPPRRSAAGRRSSACSRSPAVGRPPRATYRGGDPCAIASAASSRLTSGRSVGVAT
jgi:GH15 family glucan-1,4-alpha-glucosidase